ncbi:hypothetical protein [uncultured Shimia sp.]|uniref:hypothetical protein n=1 Tax=uncultured Shimia sp. TaxID=573152 RepID=UPI0025E6AACC|nr:hypothetical protein [uncultured Shimia sp.]
MGHETETITETHYAKMSDGHRSEVIEELRSREVWTDNEKDLMLDYHQHKLAPGSLEFKRARKLVSEREAVWDGEEVLE